MNMILLIIILFFVSLFTDSIYFNNFPLMVTSITFLVIFGFSIQLILMIASHRFPPIAKVGRFLRRPLFFTSGIFFSSTQVPPSLLKYVLVNPIFHAIELTRSGAEGNYIIVNDISLVYLIESTMLTLLISIFVYSRNKNLLLKS